MNLSKKIQTFPVSPGVYLMKGEKGAVLYVGKAKNLKKRVKSYFGRESKERYQIKFLMEKTRSIDFIETSSEKEALLLEYKLIKEHRPRYNIDQKDSKTFIRIKLGTNHKCPGIWLTRRVRKDGAEYFGPYTSALACRETVEQIIKFFQMRTCSDREFGNRSRPCIEFDIGRCTAPCIGKVSVDEYADQVRRARLFLKGKKKDLVKYLKAQMKKYSEEMSYEKAANFRDLIDDVNVTLEKQKVMDADEPIPPPDNESEDVFASIVGEGLKKKLHLDDIPRSIECVDISNIQGKHASGSLVFFSNGAPDKTRYRHFNITNIDSPNDYAMMYEVLERRLKRSDWSFPDLLIVDGGKGQLAIASQVLKKLGVIKLSVIAIAKDHRSKRGVNIYLPGRSNPVKFKENDPSLLYLVRIRDEVHRFAIAHYRRRHIKSLTK